MGMFFTRDDKPYFSPQKAKEYEIVTDASRGFRVVVNPEPSTLVPNFFYLLGKISKPVSIVQLVSYSRDYLETYTGEFTIAEGGRVSFPASIKWEKDPDFSEVGYTYQFEIKNGIGRFIKVK